MPSSTLARFIDLPVIHDPRGNLSFAEGGVHVPFEIARVYYLYDVPSGSVRAGHAHKALQQLLLPISGSFDVKLFDGRTWETVTLNRPNRGLYIGPGIWREIDNFSSGAFCVALASLRYDEGDYYREMDDFLASRPWAAAAGAETT
ncbi:FdtA/QdtA family cupin domain-containing protein [Phenylobacterium sp.]|uniref:sugar 3,4-ketoisomerase n=1 Tax=Phenylobacterium sp. TaxID=1871053 RepID=UPI00120704A2|nr:FdtA/QdtA family cupin domain-containing protein [Phenylobacterium sp.]THD60495.1 MAG: WxcM-like domain-containing protein [Phenylobacterium sp.]